MALDGTGDVTGTSDFAHLHLHSQYSLLDGAIRMKDLCGKVRERGMKSVAVTDHGNMFGAVQFYQTAKAHGVKPIFGCEAYMSEGEAAAKTDRRNFHIVLLAKNEVGFKNLQRLVSFGHLRGFYYNPRIDRQMLREHSEGLIGLSACLGGHISKLINEDRMDDARETILEYKDIFEPGSYFLELQPNRMAQQEVVNAHLAQFGRDLDVPLVATNDCHYVNREEAYAHEILMCMGMGRKFDDENRLKHSCDEFYIKNEAQMMGYFSQYPSAFENACRIAQMCNVELSLGNPELPNFQIPDEDSLDMAGYLRKVAREGLGRRFLELRARGIRPNEDLYRERLETELDIIVSMNFPGYFLIVWDFIREAKNLGVPVGPGRGSGAGSIAAYAMGITDIDPMQYNLLFERFLNPERVSMPDFDIDFCMDRREEVLQYVTERYGASRVGQIATFHSLKARGLVRDVCRTLGHPPSFGNEIAKLVPEGPKVSLSMCMTDPAPLKKAMRKDKSKAKDYKEVVEVAEAAKKLRMRADLDGEVARILDVGCSLEGLNRHAGMHAAGIVIGNRDLWEHVPCFKADGKIVTQYTMTDVETAGLVKFDFLGLKTLTVIATAERLIQRLRGSGEFEIAAVAMDDAGVFEMISKGETTGVFQLESSGFKTLLKRLQPDCFEDIVAAVALYRPGPLEGGMVDQFIECKHGRQEIEYPHPLLEHVLKETYGVFVYQEQVMQAAQVLAGFTLGGADIMRRAMGKKKKAEMDRQRALFVDGCLKTHDISDTLANEIFDLIDKFAGYGFNKSHSAAYGLITYRTAYLKHHYPEPFMAALMSCDKDKSENVVKFIAESRAMGIEVLAPCVNESDSDFSVVERGDDNGGVVRSIRFGLGGVRNVGSNAVESIMAAREDEGIYESIFEFARRVDLKRVNKRTLEGLVMSGAFDGVARDHCRSVLFSSIDAAVEQGQSAARDRGTNQVSLFAALGDPSIEFVENYADEQPWDTRTRLRNENEALGFYLTGHPLDRYQMEIARHATVRTDGLGVHLAGKDVRVGGMVCELREVQTRSGRGPMGFFQLEDQVGRVECVAFTRAWGQPLKSAQSGREAESLGEFFLGLDEEPVIVTGRLEVSQIEGSDEIESRKILISDAQALRDIRKTKARGVLVRVEAHELTDERILGLKHLVADHRGVYPMHFDVVVKESFRTRVVFGDKFKVAVDDDLMIALERLFGRRVAEAL